MGILGRHNAAHNPRLVNGESESSIQGDLMSLLQLIMAPMKVKALQPRAAGEGTVSYEYLSRSRNLLLTRRL